MSEQELQNTPEQAKKFRDFHILETGKADCSTFTLEDREVAFRAYEILYENFDEYMMNKYPEYKEKMFLIRNYLENPEFLDIIDEEFDKKIVGEKEARKVIFLVANMRNVDNLNSGTDNLVVNAVSGTGKDHVTSAVFDIIPESEKEELLRTTPKTLSYTRNKSFNQSATWKKTTLRLEDVSDAVVNDDSFKVFLSANPNKLNVGKTLIRQKVVPLLFEGKPSMILTIASPDIKNEGLRRLPMCFLNEGINQTKEILKRQAQYAKEGKSIEYDQDLIKALALLERVKVKIPFADKLVEIFKDSMENVIVRTAFPRFLDYIKSSASLFQRQRKQEDSWIIATEEDYRNGALCLAKTTDNLLMVPLNKLDRAIYDFFKEGKIENESVEDIMNFELIQRLGKGERWIRYRLDFLVSKGFLKRVSSVVQGSFKPVCKYSYNEIADFVVPKFEELRVFEGNEVIAKELTYTHSETDKKEITNNPSNTSTSSINSNNANTSNTNLCFKCYKEGANLTQDGMIFYCEECASGKF